MACLVDLADVVPLREGLTTTSQVLLMPSGIARDDAVSCVSAVSMEKILEALAGVCGQAIAYEMQAAGLRPADHAMQEGLPALLVTRLQDALKTNADGFALALQDCLKNLG